MTKRRLFVIMLTLSIMLLVGLSQAALSAPAPLTIDLNRADPYTFAEGNIARDPRVQQCASATDPPTAYNPTTGAGVDRPGINVSYYSTYGTPVNQAVQRINGVRPTSGTAGEYLSWAAPAGANNYIYFVLNWPEPHKIDAVRCEWWNDGNVTPPTGTARVEWFDGVTWKEVTNMRNPAGTAVTNIGSANMGTWNGVTFDPVITNQLRLKLQRSATNNQLGVGEWEVFGTQGDPPVCDDCGKYPCVCLPEITGIGPITGAASIDGVLAAGSLTFKKNTATTGYSYQWQIGDSASGTFTAIPGATNATLSLSEADSGKFFKVAVTGNGTTVLGNALSAAIGPVRAGATIGKEAGDIARQMVINAPHSGENCTENAVTAKEFGKGTAYGPIMTNGVEDPFFAGGGVQFLPTQKSTVKIYVVAVDFDDLKGDNYVPYGLQNSIITSGSSTYDMTYPEVIYNMIFHGANGLRALPEHKFVGSGSVTLKAIKQRLEEMSMGRMKVEVECLNERLAAAQGLDPLNDKWPWFHLEGPMFEYAVQGPADCEDYRQFARLHQAGIDAAYRDIPGLDIEDIDFIYTITPVTSHGHRAGLQGGAGLDTSFSFNDQALIQRDSEYRHEPGIKTKGGRVVGSGVFGVKGVTRSPSASITTSMHELTHGMGMFDDYSYGSMGTNTGESTGSGTGAWGVMGSNMTTTSPDLPVWRKFRMGWINDDEIAVVLPGDSVTLNLRALGSFTGDGGTYTNDPGIKTRMVLIPKEYRTRDTFGMNNSDPWIGGTVWTNGWNPNRLAYNWYDWFTNPFVGGETNAIKSWPTFYTLECRKQLGVDNAMTAANTGVVVSYIANPTTETGHGAGGFKIVSGATGLRASGTATWSDNNIGLSVRVNSSNVFYDNVTITYTGQKAGASAATKYYTGALKASDSYAVAGQPFTVDFDLTTWGRPGINDGTAAPGVSTKTATPVGVPGGIAGFEMTVEFDAANLEFASIVPSPFTYIVDRSEAAAGKLYIKGVGSKMLDKDIILSLNFQTKAEAGFGNYTVKGTITDVTLLNWRGQILGQGGVPGFDGVATIGNGTFAQFHSNNNFTVTTGITSFGGKVTVGDVPTYTITGTVVCDTPGPAPGSFIGVESTVEVRSGTTVLASGKSDWDGNYIIKGVPAGTGYTIRATKSKYNSGTSATFNVASNTAAPALKLTRQTFTVSGTIYGSYNSDGSGATPLAGVDVYLLNTGNAFSVVGGPVKTSATGTYTVTGMEVGKAFVAVAVNVKGTQYESLYSPQLHLAPNLHLPQAGITQRLELNLGSKFGENVSDYVYPANTATLGASNLYCFANTSNRTGRNVTLTQTQDIRLRMSTKSNQIVYQLRDMAGNPVGSPVNSVGTTNGDDIIRNVAPGEYYIEASRTGYISSCTMPIAVTSTRVVLRNGQGTNYMDLQAAASGNTLAGTVYNAITKKPLEGAGIVCKPFSTTYGAGALIFSQEEGSFSYLTVNTAKDIVVSKEGFISQSIYYTAGNRSGLEIFLEPADLEEYTYTVTFKDWNGTVLKTQRVFYGLEATAPDDPQRVGYTFSGWDVEFGEITADLTIMAQYEINYYTVTFADWDGEVLDEQSIAYGSAAQAPADPARKDWIFAGWDVDFSEITGDLTVTALYEPTVIGVTAEAFVVKMNGNKNELVITVTELWSDGTKKNLTESFMIDNNSAGTYTISGYRVYVDTKGNDQIRDCKVVE
jgi:hypothetical protein